MVDAVVVVDVDNKYDMLEPKDSNPSEASDTVKCSLCSPAAPPPRCRGVVLVLVFIGGGGGRARARDRRRADDIGVELTALLTCLPACLCLVYFFVLVLVLVVVCSWWRWCWCCSCCCYRCCNRFRYCCRLSSGRGLGGHRTRDKISTPIMMTRER